MHSHLFFKYFFKIFIYMANCIFVNALYEWNATMTNSSAHLNVIGD